MHLKFYCSTKKIEHYNTVQKNTITQKKNNITYVIQKRTKKEKKTE